MFSSFLEQDPDVRWAIGDRCEFGLGIASLMSCARKQSMLDG